VMAAKLALQCKKRFGDIRVSLGCCCIHFQSVLVLRLGLVSVDLRRWASLPLVTGRAEYQASRCLEGHHSAVKEFVTSSTVQMRLQVKEELKARRET
jgi:hypothetical protein